MFWRVNITIHWGVIFFVLLALVCYLFLTALMMMGRYKKCVRAFEAGEFDYILQHGQKLIFPFRKAPILTGNLHYMLAVAYFNRNDDTLFLEHINAVSTEQLQWGKHFWLAMYAVTQGEYTQYDELQKALLADGMDDNQQRSYEILSLAYWHKKEGYVLSAQENASIHNSKHNRVKQIFS